MKLTRAQKRVELRTAAEALIERLLDWDEETARPNLMAIEDAVLSIRQELGQEMVAVLVAGQEAREPVEPPACLHCGQPMRYKGQKGKAVESRLGGIEVERGYDYCPTCARGSFPPGRTA